MRSVLTTLALKSTLVLGALAALPAAASAQEKLKIGLVVTLSGPSAILGQQAKNGLELAIKDLGGRMGGREVELITVDDELKPDVAVTKVKALLDRDHVDFVVGPIFSNVLLAIHKPVTDAQTVLISPNAAPSSYAGKACNPFFYVTSYQNDQIHQISGKVAQDKGYKRAYLLVPNYQAGKDAVAGFKSAYKGEVVEESYVPLGNLDFQSELAKIASMKPDAVYTFMPGGMGVNLVRQYKQAGLAGKIPFLSAFTVDESTLPAQQDSALGLLSGTNWTPDLDTPQNKKFVNEYVAAYKATPAGYAFQAYDAGLLIDSAVKGVKGDLSDKKALQAAMRKADFTSLRGPFKFNVNGYPIQDLYLAKAGKRPDGLYETQIVEKVYTQAADIYAKDCQATN